MNKENVLKLADYIESGGAVFDMGDCLHCFIGNAWALFGGNANIGEVFGIDASQRNELCIPEHPFADCWAKDGPAHISRSRAVQQLRHLAETGEIDWEATVP